MTGQYYHGYLAVENGSFSLGPFGRVRVSDRAYRVGEDVEVRPLLVLLPGGRFLAGATLGVGMATTVCLDVLPDRAGSSWLYLGGNSAWRQAWSNAWYMAGEEASAWAIQLVEDAAQYEAIGGCSECGCEARLCDLDDSGLCCYCAEAELLEVCDD